MHIPTKESSEISILTFKDAQEMHSDSVSYDQNKWIYIPDFYSEYRYILGTVGKNPLITIGINPSTAAPDKLDNTLQSVSQISLGNKFDSFIMFNIYAQRATRPDDMDQIFNEHLHAENIKAFRWILERSPGRPAVWAAWGTGIEKRTYLKKCLQDMVRIGNEYQVRWYITGQLSKKGHPHHPLYLKKDSVFRKFDIENYLQEIVE